MDLIIGGSNFSTIFILTRATHLLHVVVNNLTVYIWSDDFLLSYYVSVVDHYCVHCVSTLCTRLPLALWYSMYKFV